MGAEMSIEAILGLLALLIIGAAIVGLALVARHDRKKSKGINVLERGHRPPKDKQRP